MTMHRNLLALVALLLMGCHQPAATQILTIVRADQSTASFTVEIAQTPAELEHGLMGRTALAADHGMLFLFPREQKLTFWMKDTPLFLDMIFIDAQKKIVSIHRKARPYDETTISTPVPAQYVLEIKGGEADMQHLAIGDRVTF